MKRKWTIHYLIALALTGIPSFFILEYERTGKIISPRTGLEIAEGSLAIFIIIVVSSYASMPGFWLCETICSTSKTKI